MSTSFYIARKIKFKEKISLVAIAISFVVMIVAVAVSSGFRHEIRNGISSLSGDIQLATADLNLVNTDSPMPLRAAFLDSLASFRGVEAVRPVLYRPGIVKAGENIHGILIKAEDNVLDSMQVSVPSTLAALLDLEVGDRLLTYFVGEKVKVRKFRIRSIYDGLLTEPDQLIVYAGLDDMRRVNGWEADEASSIELQVAPDYRTPQAQQDLSDDISTLLLSCSGEESNFIAQSSYQRFPQLYAWLDLIDNNVMLILVLMTIVAGFNMIAGLLIMLFRHISTIGVLKSMGMTDRSISLVFLKAASDMVLKGMLIGNAVALLLCFLQGQFHLIHLDPSNYFLSFVPVHLDLVQLFLSQLVSYLVIMLLLLLPCLFVSRVDPARTVRMQ